MATAGRLVALVAACFICTHARVDPDLWGHLRFGLDAISNHRLPITDPYSFTQDKAWINHEWLSEIVQAIAYQAGGVLGMMFVKIVLLVSAFAILARETRMIPDRYRWWLLSAAIIGVAPAAFTMRPQLWTLLAIPLLWHLLHTRPLLVPVLFAVWANLHGGWIVGAGVSALWVIGRAIDQWRVSVPVREASAVAIGLVATLLNPYGWRLWWFLLTTVRPSRNIGEWLPVWTAGNLTSLIIWLLITAVCIVPTVTRRRAAITWAAALPVAWLGVMSLFVVRLVPIFSEVAVLGLAGAWREKAPLKTQDSDRSSVGRFVVVDAIVLTTIALGNLIPQTQCLPIHKDTWTPDLRAASALAAPDVRGRLVLPFDWGQFAIWHFGPRLRVSIDGRRETVYSDRVIDLQSAAAHGMPDGLAFLREARPEYVWLPSTTGATAAAWLKAHDYRLDIDTGESFIATRADVPPLTMAAPQRPCFP